MTLIEALKLGKRVKRPHCPMFLNPLTTPFDFNDILADDWEIEPEEKPKLKAWIHEGNVIFLDDKVVPGHKYSIPLRAPWLDEP